MKRIGEYVETFRRIEGIRFLKWCIKYKDIARQILTPEQWDSLLIDKLKEPELSNLSTVSLIMGLRRKEAQGILEVILDTDIEKLDKIADDYIIVGIIDHINLVKKENESIWTEKFKIYWDRILENETVDQESKISSFMEWFDKEWYEWEYICHEPHPKPEIIKELYTKITGMAIHDPSFLVVKELMRSKFYEEIDDEWMIKASIRAKREMDIKYGTIQN